MKRQLLAASVSLALGGAGEAEAVGAGLQSLPSSIARDLQTDRSFQNGTLTCAAGVCQGNYGGLFPHKYLQRTTGP